MLRAERSLENGARLHVQLRGLVVLPLRVVEGGKAVQVFPAMQVGGIGERGKHHLRVLRPSETLVVTCQAVPHSGDEPDRSQERFLGRARFCGLEIRQLSHRLRLLVFPDFFEEAAQPHSRGGRERRPAHRLCPLQAFAGHNKAAFVRSGRLQSPGVGEVGPHFRHSFAVVRGRGR